MGDGEMDEPDRWRHRPGRARGAGQPGLCGELQPSAPGRTGARHAARSSRRLEGEFRGSGWNVIKLIRTWGKGWDELFSTRQERQFKQLMGDGNAGRRLPGHEANDDGAFVRKTLARFTPETLKLVEHMTDEEIFELRRGGHQPEGVCRLPRCAITPLSGQPPCCWSRPSRLGAWRLRWPGHKRPWAQYRPPSPRAGYTSHLHGAHAHGRVGLHQLQRNIGVMAASKPLPCRPCCPALHGLGRM